MTNRNHQFQAADLRHLQRILEHHRSSVQAEGISVTTTTQEWLDWARDNAFTLEETETTYLHAMRTNTQR